ncbi:MAG: phenylalanine--tRNA ligase subunit beta [Eubacteriales bacterium]|nr:phenylalanine--tRNA ligase subunit beta [Eubacteriales bacterium]
MLVSLNWLKQYTELPAELSMEQLAYDLTMRTVEVEAWHNPGQDLDKVVVGKILEIAPHPNADKLRICQVEADDQRVLQIVCGGSNLYVGELIALALQGSFVRWHGEGEPVEIKDSKLRGVASQGMICASAELSLEGLFPAEEDGIILDLTDFPGAKAGQALSELLGMDDWILEIDNKSLTNRPDLWGHYGLARELAAIYGKPLKALPEFHKAQDLPGYPLKIENTQDCPRFNATVWTGLKNGPSPFALQRTLHMLGFSVHNLLVDLSNYLMLATGQPNHAYDRAKLGEGIEVRRAKEGEKLTLLDDTELSLGPDTLVIANQEQAVGLAGIKGGKDDSIFADTSQIVLEIANFAPSLVRHTAQKYDIHTDAASRNEKGLDPARVSQALGLWQELLAQYQPEAQLVAYEDSQATETAPVQVKCSRQRVAERLGKELSPEEMRQLLEPLGFSLDFEADSFTVQVPSWRATGDVSLEADIVEELARMVGYENFDFMAPQIRLETAVIENGYDLDREVREYMAYRAGFREVILYPWTSQEFQEVCGLPDEQSVALASPPSPEERYLNASLVPALLKAAKDNERYYPEFAIFTSSQVFRQAGPDKAVSPQGELLPDTPRHLAALVFGQDAWSLFRRLKGVLEAMPGILRLENLQVVQKKKPAWADPETYLNIVNREGEVLGSLALLSAYAKTELGFKRGDLAILELEYRALQKVLPDAQDYQDLPHFPLVDMDFSLLCPEDLSWAKIEQFLGKKVRNLEFIDEYRSDKMPAGKKSLTFRVQLGKEDGTLTAEEIEAKRKSLLNTLTHALGAELRE